MFMCGNKTLNANDIRTAMFVLVLLQVSRTNNCYRDRFVCLFFIGVCLNRRFVLTLKTANMSKREALLEAACKESVEDFLNFIRLHVSKSNHEGFDVACSQIFHRLSHHIICTT